LIALARSADRLYRSSSLTRSIKKRLRHLFRRRRGARGSLSPTRGRRREGRGREGEHPGDVYISAFRLRGSDDRPLFARDRAAMTKRLSFKARGGPGEGGGIGNGRRAFRRLGIARRKCLENGRRHACSCARYVVTRRWPKAFQPSPCCLGIPARGRVQFTEISSSRADSQAASPRSDNRTSGRYR